MRKLLVVLGGILLLSCASISPLPKCPTPQQSMQVFTRTQEILLRVAVDQALARYMKGYPLASKVSHQVYYSSKLTEVIFGQLSKYDVPTGIPHIVKRFTISFTLVLKKNKAGWKVTQIDHENLRVKLREDKLDAPRKTNPTKEKSASL